LDYLGTAYLAENHIEDDIITEPDPPAVGACSDEYEFVGWSEKEVRYGAQTYTAVTFDYTMPDHDVTLEVRFEAKIFTLHLNTTIEGVTLSGTGSYEAGVLVSVTASEKVGYTFVGWLDASTGEILSSDREYAFEMEARSMTLYAQYELIKYSVTASASYADITVSVPDREYVYGDRITLIAPEAVGYHFLGWYIGDVQITSERTYELTVSGDVHVLARYARYHNIYASGSIEGACEIIAPATAYVGQTVTLTAVPNGTGYVFRGWTLADGTLWDFNSPVTESIELKAKWLKACTVTFDTEETGNIPSVTVGQGETVARPDSKILGDIYMITAWRIAGTETEWNFDEMTVTEDIVLVAEIIIVLPFAPSN
jgi:uncharacterized repeat protein (TIGR02543 family)